MGYNRQMLLWQTEEVLTFSTEKNITKMLKIISTVKCIAITTIVIAFISMAHGVATVGELTSTATVQMRHA